MAEEETKVLKIKIGSVFIDGKSYPVYQEAWQQESKKGNKYYEAREPIFVQTVKKKTQEEEGA